MKALPSVDIIIAAANEARDIEGCLRSIQSQQYPGRVQIFVALDRRSRDQTADIATRLGATVVQNGRGPAQLRNLAASQGTGQFLAFLDAHCFAHCGWLMALVRKIRETGAAGVEGQIVYEFSQGQPASELPRLGGSAAAEKSAYAWLKTGNCIYSRQVWERAGGFDPKLWSCEDVDLSWRVLLQGNPLAFCPQAVVTHLDRHGSWKRLRRSFFYGVGAGQLAHRFALANLSRSHRADWKELCYLLGAWIGRNLLSQGISRFQSLPTGRAWGEWDGPIRLRPGVGVNWWYAEKEVVLVRPGHRLAIEGVGQFFWRGLTRAWSRERVIAGTCQATRCPAPWVAKDLDAWVEALTSDGWLERAQISSGE